MSEAAELSIVIVPYRVREILRDCLDSLYGAGGLSGLASPEVIVVDNASGDGTVEMLRRDFPQVKVIASPKNLGFSGANNLGIAAATGRNILLLNPDTLIPSGALKKCVDFLESQPENVGAMTCRVESPDGSLQPNCSRRNITPWSECCRALLLDRIFSRADLFNREPIIGWNRQDTREVECILGAFMLIRRPVMEKVGLLDERFFLMYEDTDWCKRCWDAGYRIVFWPGARITHLGGQSWKQEPILTYRNSHISAMQYFEKHHPKSLSTVRRVTILGMALKITLLRLNLLRRPGDEYTKKHLEMAQAALVALRQGTNKTDASPKTVEPVESNAEKNAA
jgi:GT2 family glycosyltransferase